MTEHRLEWVYKARLTQTKQWTYSSELIMCQQCLKIANDNQFPNTNLSQLGKTTPPLGTTTLNVSDKQGFTCLVSLLFFVRSDFHNAGSNDPTFHVISMSR